jgi:hypothetical protein
MINENWIFLGVVLNLIGTATYVLAVLKGKARPNRVTWFILSVAPFVAFSAMITKGVSLQQSLMTFTVGLSPLIVFVSTFLTKHPKWKVTKFDLSCGALALVGLGLWAITKEGDLAILFSVIADLLAFTPTLVKAFKYPDTESSWLPLLAWCNSVIAVLIITKWDFTHMAFPVYLAVVNLLAFSLIYFKPGLNFVATFSSKKNEG